MVLSDKYFKFYPCWLVGYYYGDRVIELCRRFHFRAIGNGESAALCVLAAVVLNWAFLTLRVTWLSGETPTPFKLHINRGAYQSETESSFGSPWLPMYTLPNWIWSPRVSGPNSVRAWNPVWARTLYIIFDYATSAVTTLFIIAACTLVSWRAARCGNAALGKYMLLQTFPTAYVSWVLFLVFKLGVDRSSVFLVQLAQLVILLGWPFAFVYIVGPLMTAFIVAVPKFVFWASLVPRGELRRALAEATAYLEALPHNSVAWVVSIFRRNAPRLASSSRSNSCYLEIRLGQARLVRSRHPRRSRCFPRRCRHRPQATRRRAQHRRRTRSCRRRRRTPRLRITVPSPLRPVCPPLCHPLEF